MPVSRQPPIYLTILRWGDINIINLAEVGSLIPRSEIQVDETFLQELVAEVSHLALSGYGRKRNQAEQRTVSVSEPGAIVHELQRKGSRHGGPSLNV